MKMRRNGKVDNTGKTNQRFKGNERARIPVISIILLVAFVGIFMAMVSTYVLVPEPTPVVAPRPTPKPTPVPQTGGTENLHFENVMVYASERSTSAVSYDAVVMDVTGAGAVNLRDVVATFDGISTYISSSSGATIKAGDQVILVSVEQYMACGCPQPIVEIEPGDQVRVVVRHVPTRNKFVDTTMTAIAGDKSELVSPGYMPGGR
jgi:FlaG/FlaF family flagellin (archaellin)